MLFPVMWTVLKTAAENWSAHRDSRQGAALAYYSVFSLGPVIVIAIAVAGLFYGRNAASGEVANSIKGMLGDAGASAVQAMLADAGRPRQGLIATVTGIGLLLFAALGVVVQLKDALNTVWEVEPESPDGVWQFIRSYIVSFAGILSLGFLLLVSLVISAALAAIGKYANTIGEEWMLHAINTGVSLAVVSLMFAMMFKWLPDIDIDWYDVWPGAVLTAVLFELGKFGIAFYIAKQGLESTYGAAASIIVVLVWVYFSSQVVLIGAEITHAFAKARGSKAENSPLASGDSTKSPERPVSE
jgi:membrane protein